ncbi:MAG: hypothetical protein HYT63_01015 [Candidatus Yanofskybacteria bacterium]|nr:hypothetical protein [Candidatus Yanofskybacteria bacterium]
MGSFWNPSWYTGGIDGKKIAGRILEEVAEKVAKLPKSLKMAAILVGPSTGSGQASRKFLELKKKAAESVGVGFDVHEFSADTKTRDLIFEVEKIAQNPDYDGVLIELPVPEKIDSVAVLNAVRATFQFCLRPLRRWKVFLSTTKLKSKIKKRLFLGKVFWLASQFLFGWKNREALFRQLTNLLRIRKFFPEKAIF